MSVSPSMADRPLRLWAERNISLSRLSSQRCWMVLVERLDPLVQLQQVRVELGQELVRLVEKVAQQAVQQFVLGFWLRVAHRSLPFIAAAVGTATAASARNP